jgi:hypothetical protein
MQALFYQRALAEKGMCCSLFGSWALLTLIPFLFVHFFFFSVSNTEQKESKKGDEKQSTADPLLQILGITAPYRWTKRRFGTDSFLSRLSSCISLFFMLLFLFLFPLPSSLQSVVHSVLFPISKFKASSNPASTQLMDRAMEHNSLPHTMMSFMSR